ncbi:MAG: hypothetical protein LBV19_04745 [Streptococcaceae bacterium]|jgi:membrane protease YdiL (CAAX protease family)|nr:hypothetical protein [Streptococcaceae bacterium]
MTKLTTIEKIYLAISLIVFVAFSSFIPYLLGMDKINKAVADNNAAGIENMVGVALVLAGVITLLLTLITAFINKIIVYLVTKQRVSFGYTLFIYLISALVVQVTFTTVQFINKDMNPGVVTLSIQSIMRNALFIGLLYRKIKKGKLKMLITFFILVLLDLLVAIFLK